MTQLHCYAPDRIAQQAQRRANKAGLSLSRYFAEPVKHDVASHADWPEAYFDNFGQREGEQLVRPEQLPVENRLEFK